MRVWEVEGDWVCRVEKCIEQVEGDIFFFPNQIFSFRNFFFPNFFFLNPIQFKLGKKKFEKEEDKVIKFTNFGFNGGKKTSLLSIKSLTRSPMHMALLQGHVIVHVSVCISRLTVLTFQLTLGTKMSDALKNWGCI